MMSRLLTRIAGLAAGLLLLAPLLSLVPAATLDVGPEGRVRFSLFPLVLAIYDPLIATSLAQSVAVATAISIASVLIGALLGGMLARRRLWGRSIFRWLLASLAVMPPAFLALGIIGLLGMLDLGSSSLENDPSGPPARFPASWRWGAWAWAALIPGSALVLDVTLRALELPLSDWEAPARMAGAGRWRLWLDFTWPRIRPRVLGTACGLFGMILADPGTPLVLGLRRTVGYQVTVGTMVGDPFPRVAALALLVLVATLAIRSLVGLRIRSIRREGTPSGQADWRAAVRPEAPTSGRVATGAVFALCLAAVLCVLPLVGLARLAIDTRATQPDGHDAVATLGFAGSSPAGVVTRTAGLALAVCLVLFVSCRVGPWFSSGRRAPRKRSRALRIHESVPPLVLGIGVLSLIRTSVLAVRLVGNASNGQLGPVSTVLEWIGNLDPIEGGASLIVLGVCLAYVPAFIARNSVRTHSEAHERRIEQARLLGAGRRRSLALAEAGGRGIPTRTLLTCGVLAAISIAPAIVLCGPEPGWSLGPVIVALSDHPGGARGLAARLALGAIGAFHEGQSPGSGVRRC
ncbi:MAG: hypothetical protein U0790_24410 [Isosphaeraceae bacterium]